MLTRPHRPSTPPAAEKHESHDESQQANVSQRLFKAAPCPTDARLKWAAAAASFWRTFAFAFSFRTRGPKAHIQTADGTGCNRIL